MKKIKKEKTFWKKYFNFPDKLEDIPQAIEHINLRCTEVNDEDLEFLVGRIKLIHQLDLDQTEISNEGLKYLAQLQGLKELRLKDNYPITDGCIPYLNRLTSLTLLHLASTAVTLDGLLQLDALQNLERLFFSADNNEDISQKMLQLKIILPNCEFIINSRIYSFDDGVV
jgi:hypothetical protein